MGETVLVFFIVFMSAVFLFKTIRSKKKNTCSGTCSKYCSSTGCISSESLNEQVQRYKEDKTQSRKEA